MLLLFNGYIKQHLNTQINLSSAGWKMKEILILPIIIPLIVGVTLEIAEIAESTSDKVIRYTESMEEGVECAFTGRTLMECSPELFQADFEDDLRDIGDMAENLEEHLGEMETIHGVELNETQMDEIAEIIEA